MHGDEKPRDNDYLTGENQLYFAVRLMEQVPFPPDAFSVVI